MKTHFSSIFLFSTFCSLAIAFSPVSPIDDKIDSFLADTVAHKMRLAARAHELLSNSNFFSLAPEYKKLEKYKEEVIRLIFEHDSSKIFLERENPLIQTAGEMEGNDWRSLDDSNPLKARAKKSFSGLTQLDVSHESKCARIIFSKDNQARELAEEFMKIIDLDDVPKLRGSEFGGANGSSLKRKLQPVSEWIQTPEMRKGVSKDSLQRMVNLGKVLELPEYGYSHEVKAYTAATVRGKRFENLAESFFKSKFPQSHFGLLPKDFTPSKYSQFAKPTTEAKMGASKGKIGKVIRKIPLVVTAAGVVDRGLEYVKNPDEKIAEGYLKNLFFMSYNTPPNCKDYYCHKFLLECKRALNTESPNWSECLELFYKKSLDKQVLYLSDKELKDSISKTAPVIKNLRCEGTRSLVEFEHTTAMGYGFKVQTQEVYLTPNGKLDKVIIPATELDSATERIDFKDNEYPEMIHRCETPTTCIHISAKEVQDRGIKAPRSKRLLNFMELQASNIQACCQSQSCQNHFSDKGKASYLSARNSRTAK